MNEGQIAGVVDLFYAKVRRDSILGPIFDDAIGDQWDSHLATMRTFWSSVMLGSAAYKGNPMAAHLRLPRLDAAHFERWLNLWRETASEICGDQAEVYVQRAEAIAGRLLRAVTAGAVMPAIDLGSVRSASR
jgi:hemoglobin